MSRSVPYNIYPNDECPGCGDQIVPSAKVEFCTETPIV